MKKVLLVIHHLNIGGAQKSLAMFLQCLAKSEVGKEYEIDLLAVNPTGDFLGEIPSEVKILKPHPVLQWMGSKFRISLLREAFSWKALFAQAVWIFKRRAGLTNKRWNLLQNLWTCWKKQIPNHPGKYDVAISYMDGYCNYYVMDKVNADKKVLWLHSDYQEQQYDSQFDQIYFENCDSVITISEKCKERLLEAFSHLDHKIHILNNITVYDDVLKKSEAEPYEAYENKAGVKLLSVGRLHIQKGMDLAAESAKLLKEKGIAFQWLIVGAGEERERIQKMIDDYALNDYFRLLGKRSNPYPYMKQCDIMVQPSRVEGKSIVLDEAKLLCKPIVATNYSTVTDAIEHSVNGWIVEMNAQAIAEGIMKLAQDTGLRQKFVANLQKAPKGNEAQLQQYIDVML